MIPRAKTKLEMVPSSNGPSFGHFPKIDFAMTIAGPELTIRSRKRIDLCDLLDFRKMSQAGFVGFTIED